MHAVVILAASYGSAGEVHEFAISLGRKVLVWLPNHQRRGFLSQGVGRLIEANGGRLVFFRDVDVAACAIALASVDFVNDKRHLQAMIEEQIAQLRDAAPIKTEDS